MFNASMSTSGLAGTKFKVNKPDFSALAATINATESPAGSGNYSAAAPSNLGPPGVYAYDLYDSAGTTKLAAGGSLNYNGFAEITALDPPVSYDTVNVSPAPSATSCSGSTGNLNAAANAYLNMAIAFKTGANAGLARRITASTGQSLTFAAFPAAPAANDVFQVLGA